MEFQQIRNFIIFISLLVVLVSGTVNAFEDVYGFFHIGGQQTSFIPYENTKLKYNIQYPSNWQKEEHLNDFVTFIAPIVDSSQYKYPAGLGIASMSVGNVSLNAIKNVHMKNMTNNLKDFKLLESADVILADKRPAKKIVFTAMDGEEERKSLQLITKNNDRAYLFTYKAGVDQYDKYFPTIQTMLNSLIFLQ